MLNAVIVHCYAAIACAIFIVAPLSAQVPAGSVLHLRADSGIVVSEGRVSLWRDISGNENNVWQDVAALQPQHINKVANGKPALRFSGVEYMNSKSVFPVGKDYSVAFVMQLNSYNATNNVVSGNSRALYFNGSPYLRLLHGGNFNQQAISPIALHNGMNIVAVSYVEATRQATITINTIPAGTTEVPANTDPVIFIGAFAQGSFLVGDIAEIILYDRALNGLEQTALQELWISRYAITVPRPYNPPAAGSLLWLKADSGVVATPNGNVSRWNDRSGNGYAAHQDSAALQPMLVPNATFNLPVVRFPGAGNFMEATPIFPTRSDYTLTFVVSLNDLGATNNVVSGNSHAHWFGGAPYARLLHGDFNAQAVTSIAARQGELTIVTMAYSESRRRAIISINGVIADSATVPQNLDSIIYLGAFQRGNVLVGDIAEVILYNRELTTADRIQTETYLFRKYGIPVPPPPLPLDTTFINIPAPLQLFPRGADDSATVNIAGIIRVPGWDSIVVDVAKADAPWLRNSMPLNYANGSAPFTSAQRIHATLAEYRFTVTLRKRGGTDSVIAVRDSIVCGDAIFICGQSNSIFGHAGQGAAQNQFCRTFGLNFSQNRRDTLWALASGAGSGGGPDVGAWGMRIARLYTERTGVPVCIINGGVGGTAIELHQRNDAAPLTLSTIYGSMLYRAQRSGLASHTQAMFWYQGESNTVANYAANFRALRQDWLEDYPNLKKFYLVQIRPGCAAGSHSALRELQRTLPDTFPDVVAYSPMGVAGHDGCHYAPAGYDTIGVHLFRLLERDFLGLADTLDIASPDVRQVFFTTPESNEVGVTFTNTRTGLILTGDVEVGGVIRTFADAFLINDTVQAVRSVRVVGDTVLLELRGSYPGARLSYIPDQNYLGISVVYEGPWIVNSRGLGAFSFHRFPIRQFGTTAVPQEKPKRSKMDLR